MDLQTMLDNAVQAKRNEDMKTSEQLTLGELILKLEATTAYQKFDEMKSKYSSDGPYVNFDFEYIYPTGVSSWRGSYRELAITFDYHDWIGEYHKPEKQLTVVEFVDLLKSTIGKQFTGYKGGEFTMGKNTPVWVANYSNTGNTAIVDVVDEEYEVILVTKYLPYE